MATVIKTDIGNSYQAPESWEEITLQSYLGFLDISMPECLSTIMDEADSDKRVQKYRERTPTEQAECLNYYCQVVSHFIVGENQGLLDWPKRQVEQLFWYLLRILNHEPEYQYTPVIVDRGRSWYLPERFMTDGTVGSFLTACGLQQVTKKEDQVKAFPKILCLLCRSSKDEPYDEDELLKREPMFLQWTMDKVWSVIFFLAKQKQEYITDLQTYTTLAQIKAYQLRRGAKT